MHIISSACLHARMHAAMNNKYMWESPLMQSVHVATWMITYNSYRSLIQFSAWQHNSNNIFIINLFTMDGYFENKVCY